MLEMVLYISNVSYVEARITAVRQQVGNGSTTEKKYLENHLPMQ